MVAAPQQRGEDGRQRRHAGGEADRALAGFHARDARFQRRGGGRTLPRVGEPGLALEHRRQLARIFVDILGRRMHGFVHGAVLGGLVAVGVNDGGGKAVLVHDVGRSKRRAARRRAAARVYPWRWRTDS
ncbi:Uncharacterised protein [Bordetella pertussis]|nr:Uncharacterised protein [Bordetella pertussis]